jgi:hypothetical protein
MTAPRAEFWGSTGYGRWGVLHFTDDKRCISCGADVDHYLGCPDDPNPDYEAEAALPERASGGEPC